VSTLSYAQWIALELTNRSTDSIWITGIKLDYGKLYDGDSMDNEINPNDIVGTEIKSKQSYTIYSCGRENLPSGTEGTVAVSDKKKDGNRIADIYWDCPYTGRNKLEKPKANKDWLVDVPTALPDGAIGHVAVKFRKDD